MNENMNTWDLFFSHSLSNILSPNSLKLFQKCCQNNKLKFHRESACTLFSRFQDLINEKRNTKLTSEEIGICMFAFTYSHIFQQAIDIEKSYAKYIDLFQLSLEFFVKLIAKHTLTITLFVSCDLS